MSPSTDPADAATDSGFSLVEVIAALGVLMVVMVALIPQLVVGIKATGTARLATQAKGVAQGQLEKMRNLPYNISPDAGDYRDVLDTYYRNLTAPSVGSSCMTGTEYTIPPTGWSGYVQPGSSARCGYEPVGAFYRTVSSVSAAEAGAPFTVVVDARFLSGISPQQPVTPPATYDSQELAPNSRSTPAASQIGVVVTVLYREGKDVRAISTSTQFANRPTATTRVRGEANVATVALGSETAGGGALTLSAGLVDITGSLTYASTVNANLAGTTASSANGDQDTGADASLAAPPSSTAGFVNEAPGELTADGCLFACWGHTRIGMGAVSATGGLPKAGSQTAPMESLVTDKGGSHAGISFSNSAAADYRTGLGLTTPLIRLSSSAASTPSGISPGCVSGGSGTASYITAGGYVSTTGVADAVAPSTVDACAVASASTISLFPTAFAPDGVVVVELTQAKVRCTVTGLAHAASATYDFAATVKYWNGTGYQTLTITDSMTSDPLRGVNLATTSVGNGRVLGDYVASWSALLASEATATQADGVAEVSLPGIIKFASTATRADPGPIDGLDPTSVVSVAVGTLGCHAEDKR